MNLKELMKMMTGLVPITSDTMNLAITKVVADIRGGVITINKLVDNLDPLLTNKNYEVRLKGVEFLSEIIVRIPTPNFNSKEIEVMSEFMKLRLVDHRTMALSTLNCLSYFMDCVNKPEYYNKDLLFFLKGKADVRSMEPKARTFVFQIIEKVVEEKRQTCTVAQGDLIYFLMYFVHGEDYPDNILLAFKITAFILRNFKDIQPYLDDIFEWLTSYYPISYTPNNPLNNSNIKRLDLITALEACFFASPGNSDNVLTFLLEKLESRLLPTKLETLVNLARSFEVFPLDSVKTYTRTFWTATRSECLKEKSLVNSRLLELYCYALSAMTKKLAEDRETYFAFISEMYEELSIAFRKPEMELFEPASILLSHAVQPELAGFEFILDKILPISLNALINDKDLRPITGISYIFRRLHLTYPNAKLSKGTTKNINEYVAKVFKETDEQVFNFIQTIIECRIDIKSDLLNTTINKLKSELDERPTRQIEDCLAMICLHHEKYEIIYEGRTKRSLLLFPLIESVKHYETMKHFDKNKLCIYLRVLILHLDTYKCNDLGKINHENIKELLEKLRDYGVKMVDSPHIVEKIIIIHEIILNKLKIKANHEQLLKQIFKSEYCQKLDNIKPDGPEITEKVYLPLLRGVMRSLSAANNLSTVPIINLLLNYMVHRTTSLELAMETLKCFSFVQEQKSLQALYDLTKHYQRFTMHHQKFYIQVRREVVGRYEVEEDKLKRVLLMGALMVQIPLLEYSVFMIDCEWMLRELLKLLSSSKSVLNDNLLIMIFDCIDCLMTAGSTPQVESFVESTINAFLHFSCEPYSTEIRERALKSLAVIPDNVDECEVVPMRSGVLKCLEPILSSSKRIIRQTATETKMRWSIVTQACIDM